MIQVEGIFEDSSAPSLQSKSVTYTENGTATITQDGGHDGLSSVDVTVNVASGGGGGLNYIHVEFSYEPFNEYTL